MGNAGKRFRYNVLRCNTASLPVDGEVAGGGGAAVEGGGVTLAGLGETTAGTRDGFVCAALAGACAAATAS